MPLAYIRGVSPRDSASCRMPISVAWLRSARKASMKKAARHFPKAQQELPAALRDQHNENGKLQPADEIARSRELAFPARFDAAAAVLPFLTFRPSGMSLRIRVPSNRPSALNAAAPSCWYSLGINKTRKLNAASAASILAGNARAMSCSCEFKMPQKPDGQVDQEQQRHQGKRQVKAGGEDAGAEHHQRFHARARRHESARRMRLQAARQNRQQHAIESHREEQQPGGQLRQDQKNGGVGFRIGIDGRRVGESRLRADGLRGETSWPR